MRVYNYANMTNYSMDKFGKGNIWLEINILISLIETNFMRSMTKKKNNHKWSSKVH